jgi:hypothetical protein
MSSRKILEELKAVLEANSEIQKVSLGALLPLAQENSSAAVYISPETITLEPDKMHKGSAGYSRHLLINLYCNLDCGTDPLALLDFAESIESSILKDSQIWSTLVDRDIASVIFDEQELFPKRTCTILLDISYSLSC